LFAQVFAHTVEAKSDVWPRKDFFLKIKRNKCNDVINKLTSYSAAEI